MLYITQIYVVEHFETGTDGENSDLPITFLTYLASRAVLGVILVIPAAFFLC